MMDTGNSSWGRKLTSTVTRCRRLVTLSVLASVFVAGIITGAHADDVPDSVPFPEAFDAGAVDRILADATNAERAAAGAFVGLASPIAVDPLFGSATASVPLELPPARLTPEVAVRYSSNGVAVAGPFGAGWSLSLGSVTRNAATGVPYNQGGSTYTDAPGFVLVIKGISIQLDTCTNAPNCASWAASSEDTWVNAQFDRNNNIWTVSDSSGTEYTFGNGSGARTGIDVSSASTTFGWYLTDVTDKSTNSIQISYQATSSTYAYPQQIDYGGNSGAGYQAIFHVGFDYVPLANFGIGVQRINYRNGFPEQLTQLTSSVSVWADCRSTGPCNPGTTHNSPTRRYMFTYDASPDNGMPLLKTVDEDINHPPSTTFSYSSGMSGLQSSTVTFSPIPTVTDPWALTIPANGFHNGLRDWVDMNGDGLPDLIDAAATGLQSTRTDLYVNSGGGARCPTCRGGIPARFY